jgi:hypothetical protein
LLLQLTAMLLMAVAALAFVAYRRDAEQATIRIARICQQEGLQWLDQSVRLERLRGHWHNGVRWTRDYGFDCSGDRANRWHGVARFEGHRLLWVVLDTPEGRLYLDAAG